MVMLHSGHILRSCHTHSSGLDEPKTLGSLSELALKCQPNSKPPKPESNFPRIPSQGHRSLALAGLRRAFKELQGSTRR